MNKIGLLNFINSHAKITLLNNHKNLWYLLLFCFLLGATLLLFLNIFISLHVTLNLPFTYILFKLVSISLEN